MRALLDTNVVLDLLLERRPWFEDARGIVASVLDGRTSGFLSAGSLAVIHYVIRRHAGAALAIVAVERCLQTFEIVEVDRLIAQVALSLRGPDFEDDLQIAAAQRIAADCIVTRNPRHFAHAVPPGIAPAAFLSQLSGLT